VGTLCTVTASPSEEEKLVRARTAHFFPYERDHFEPSGSLLSKRRAAATRKREPSAPSGARKP
jgi:hypothetical protein